MIKRILNGLFLNKFCFYILNKFYLLFLNDFYVLRNYIGDYFYYFIYNKKIFIYPLCFSKFIVCLLGTYFSILSNTIFGLISFYTINLKLVGIGYYVNVFSDYLSFNVGYSHSVKILIPCGVYCNVYESGAVLIIKSVDNILLGNFCAKLLNIRKYNIFNGKGVLLKNFKYFKKKVVKKK